MTIRRRAVRVRLAAAGKSVGIGFRSGLRRPFANVRFDVTQQMNLLDKPSAAEFATVRSFARMYHAVNL